MNKNNHIEYKKERSQEFDMASQPNMLYHDACIIIEQAKAVAFKAVNDTLIKRNWLLGMRIQHEVLKDQRAEYGEQVIGNLATSLTKMYGKGFSTRNLYHFVRFYQEHADSFHIESESNILQAIPAKLAGLNIQRFCSH